MTHVKAGQRRRAKAPKVRTGCRTCKGMLRRAPAYHVPIANHPARRIKCDEGQPSCKKCISTGRPCEGYEPVAATRQIRFITLMPISYSSNEMRSFQHFQEKTLSQLFSFIQEDIWTSHIVQTANLDPGIWHSVVAFSSFHENFLRRGICDDQSCDRFALKQYNMSIQKILRSERNSSNAHIHLISCILFICIEVLRSKTLTVIQLLRTGYGILKEERIRASAAYTESNAPSVRDRNTLFAHANVFLCRIASQAYMLLKNVDPGLAALVAEVLDFENFGWNSTSTIDSLNHAQHTLSTIRLELETYDQNGVGMTPIRIRWWLSAFARFKKEFADQLTSPEDQRAIALMELQSRYVGVEIAVCDGESGIAGDPLRWDAHTDVFYEMIHYAALAMDLDSQVEASGGQRSRAKGKSREFNMHTGVVPILYGIILNCREPTIRRQATALLSRTQRVEGVWNSEVLLAVALKAVAVEERGTTPLSSGEIPAAARVRRIAVQPVHDSEYSQTHSRSYLVGYEVGSSWAWEDADNFGGSEAGQP